MVSLAERSGEVAKEANLAVPENRIHRDASLTFDFTLHSLSEISRDDLNQQKILPVIEL